MPLPGYLANFYFFHEVGLSESVSETLSLIICIWGRRGLENLVSFRAFLKLLSLLPEFKALPAGWTVSFPPVVFSLKEGTPRRKVLI